MTARFALLAVSLLSACEADSSRQPTPGPAGPLPLDGEGTLSAETIAALHAALDASAEAIAAPGAVAAVRGPDGAAWVGTTGVTSTESGIPVTDDLAFRAGSITKTMVAAAVLLTVDEGTLSLTDPVVDWYPDVPAADRVTLRDLLGHTSGLRNYTEISEFYAALGSETADDPGLDDVIAWSADDGGEFEPGSAYSYSNTNYHVLGRILEQTLDQPLDQILADRLWGPLGLEHTWLDGYGEPTSPTEVAGGHLNGLPDRPLSPDWRWASGGLNASARDLVRWVEALVDGEVLPAATRDRMQTPSALSIEAGSPYGLGMRIRELPCGTARGHTGSTMGFQSDMFRTDEGVTVVVHVNDFFAEASDIAYALCDVLADGPG